MFIPFSQNIIHSPGYSDSNDCPRSKTDGRGGIRKRLSKIFFSYSLVFLFEKSNLSQLFLNLTSTPIYSMKVS